MCTVSTARAIGLDCSMDDQRRVLHGNVQRTARGQAGHCRLEHFPGVIVHTVVPGAQTSGSPFFVLPGLPADGNAGGGRRTAEQQQSGQ
ncbi:hypothetical protein D9M70_612110 [compost metagenome]